MEMSESVSSSVDLARREAEEEEDVIGFRRSSLSVVTSESVASSVDLARRGGKGC